MSVYDETVHKGLLRHIYIRKGSATNEFMVCAVINGNRLPAEDKLVASLLDANKNIKSILIKIVKKSSLKLLEI